MDLENVGFDGLLGYPSDSEAKRKHNNNNSEDFSPVSENQQHNMLCFSSANANANANANDLCHYYPPSADLSYGFNGATRGGGGGGAFTQSQWVELENQALIYKYINANALVPLNLLVPILKASGYASFPPFSVGWGSSHLGFSNSTDPEPGRCRRTDGKKWRCSRDSVPDHKYCERHMNRGRHRSRTPVEGQTTARSAAKLVPAPAPASAASDGGLSLSQPGGSIASPCSTNGNRRVFLNTEKKKPYSGSEPANGMNVDNINGGGDSLLNNNNNNGSSYNMVKNKLHMINNYLPNSWWFDSNNNNNHINGRTHLSISIPMMSDFIPSFPSTEMGLGLGLGLGEAVVLHEKPLSAGPGWTVPVQWGGSISNYNCMGGGPLGEVVLNKTKRNNDIQTECSSTLSLDILMSSSSTNTNWDNSPTQGGTLGSSPTGVLHKVHHFGNSVSNSSAGSSPRTETHIY